MYEKRWNRRQFLCLASLAGFGAIYSQRSTSAQTLSTYSQTVLAKNPVGYWRLGELQTGTMFDSSKNKRHGKYYGKPIFSEKGAIQCNTNKAVKFGNAVTYGEVANQRSFSQPTSGKGLTVEVWMRPDALEFTTEEEGYIHWLGKGESDRHEWALRFYRKSSERPNRISAYIWNPSGGLGAGAYFQDVVETKKWLHIVATYDPGDKTNPMAGVSIYKNGQLRMSPSTSPAARYKQYDILPAQGTAPLRFGTRDLKTFLVGALDEVAIYPRVLSSTEILAHYKLATRSC